jgi:hypothetical protein
MSSLQNLVDRSIDADERLRDLERRYRLLEYKVDGWCAWPLLRFRVGSLYANLPMDAPPPVGQKQRIILAFKDIPNHIFLKQSDMVIKTYTSALGEKTSLGYKDIYFDDLLPGRSYFKIEAINNYSMLDRSKNAQYPVQIYTSFVDLRSYLISEILPPNRDVVVASRAIFEALDHGDEPIKLTYRQIQFRLSRFHHAWHIYRSILQRLHPKVVLVADPTEYEIIAAAQSLRIRTVELEHGYLDRYHWSYSWQADARPLKEAMPVADQLFLYGNYFKEELDSREFWGNRLTVVGSPRLDNHRTQPHHKPVDYCNIVFTTQGIDRNLVIKFLNQFLGLAETASIPIQLTIKLHPVYDLDPSPYQDGFSKYPNVRILTPTQQPGTLNLISESHFHLSISSTCHYEALALGTPTIILPFETNILVSNLVKAGHASHVNSPEDLILLIREWRQASIPEEVGNYYFKPGAIKNIAKELCLREEEL